MKHQFSFIAFLLIVVGMSYSCSGTSGEVSAKGSIYGIVVESSNTEPLAGLGVELYRVGYDHNSLLLKTVTFDDGHFEFTDLDPDEYLIKVVATGYDESSTEYYVTVESGRQARVDMQVKRVETHMSVITHEPKVDGQNVTLSLTVNYKSGYSPTEKGFLYSTDDNPIVHGKQVKVSWSSSTTITNLASGIYYVVAYAINDNGIAYGEVKSFSVSSIPAFTCGGVTYQVSPDQGSMDWESAVKKCNSLAYRGYDDWYLPGKLEMLEMYENREEIGGFLNDSGYWMNSGNASYASVFYFYRGTSDWVSNIFSYRVRCVRLNY